MEHQSSCFESYSIFVTINDWTIHIEFGEKKIGVAQVQYSTETTFWWDKHVMWSKIIFNIGHYCQSFQLNMISTDLSYTLFYWIMGDIVNLSVIESIVNRWQ